MTFVQILLPNELKTYDSEQNFPICPDRDHLAGRFAVPAWLDLAAHQRRENRSTPEYADLQPQRFNQPLEKVFAAALEVSQTQGWEIRETKPEQGIIEAVATTRLFKFKDDVTITVSNEGSSTVVNVRSKSRIGKGDMGANARRIRTFQAELAKKL